jgi:hypothetical protein
MTKKQPTIRTITKRIRITTIIHMPRATHMTTRMTIRMATRMTAFMPTAALNIPTFLRGLTARL